MTPLSALLEPLDAAAPCGADLSFSSDFDAIAEMRRADDPTLSQGEWVTELKSADWPGAAAACEVLLQHRSKDLRVAGWLLEAWSQQRGYAGLADGIELAHGLCERFWPGVHPQPDGADFELRTGALARLLAQVSALAAALPVLRHGATHLALRDLDAARALGAALSKARDPGEVPTAGRVTPDDVAKAQRATPATLLSERLGHARRARAALGALQAVVDGHLGADGPGFSSARDALDNAVHALERLAREAGASTSPSTPSTAEGTPADAAVPAGTFGGAPATRAQALAQLRLVAEFFRTTEPHSPVAYLADRAAHWGELPLHEWLRLVLKDGGTLAQVEELLGVPPRPDER